MNFSVFDFKDYREFLRAWIDGHPRGSRGQVSKMATAIGVSSSMMSLVLKGDETLTPEHVAELCHFLGLNELEEEYLNLLVELDRAGSPRLKQRLQKKLAAAKGQSLKISQRVRRDKELADDTKALYYSHWYFTGIRNLIAIEGYQDAQAVAERLRLPISTVNQCLQFMLEHGLCRKEGDRIVYGPAFTHLEAESPFVSRHHQNWRNKAFEHMIAWEPKNLFYTSPMSLSESAAAEVRALLPTVIEKVQKIAGPSASEKVYCLNLDWFEY